MRRMIKRTIALVLAMAMVLAMSVVTFAADATLRVEKTDDGNYVATIMITSGVESFDYGVTYDSAKLAVKSTKWSGDFSTAYDEVDGIKSKNDQTGYDYIVFGGTSNGVVDYAGAIATVEFTVVDGAVITNKDVITLVANSKSLKKEVDATGKVASIRTAESYAPISIIKLDSTDAVVTVTQNAEGNYVASVKINEKVESFDFGVTYDSAKLAVKATKWNADFTSAYDEVDGIKAKNDQIGYDYVVIGGTANGMADYTGEVATIEFTVVDGATITDADVITLIEDSKGVKKEFDAAGVVASIRTAAGYDPISTAKLIDEVVTPITEVPVTNPPVTEVPATEVPATEVPVTQAPTTQAPTTVPTTAPTTAPPKVDAKEDTGIVNTLTQLAAFIANLRAKLNLADLTPEERAEIEAQIAVAEALIASGTATEEEITAAYNNIVKAVEAVNGGSEILKEALKDAGLTKLANKVVITDSPKTTDAGIMIPIIAMIGAITVVMVASRKREEA